MRTAAMALPSGPEIGFGESLKVAVLPSEARAKQRADLTQRASDLIQDVALVLDGFITTALETRTAEDFTRVLAEVFPSYVAVMTSLGGLIRVLAPQHTIDRIGSEWFCELERDFRDLGPKTFGEDLAERGLFTVLTLRKIVDVAQRVSKVVSSSGDASDSEITSDFAAKALWTRFHVDCLAKAMHENTPLYPGILEPIRDGLRMAVNTYACIRLLADKQNPISEPVVDNIEWTDEDEMLLADSMQDLGVSKWSLNRGISTG